jgi:hypothetical protein
MHAEHPGYATREMILSGTIRTRGDAVSAIDLAGALEGDQELVEHLMMCLRQYVQVD